MARRPILLASGGTGGHLFPALSLAIELRARDYEVHLATDHRTRKFDSGFDPANVHHVAADTLRSRSPLRLLKTIATLARGTFSAWRLIGRIRPEIVVGFGGYPTLPTVWAARWRRVVICLHEQNGVLGRANRALGKYAQAIATSLPEVKFLDGALAGKARLTGNPVRPPVVEARGIAYQSPVIGEPFRLLVFGGSQGTRFFSDILPEAISRLSPEQRAGIEIVQQCRQEDRDRVAQAYAKLKISSEVGVFFNDLPLRIARSHLVICRSGASTAAELTVIGRPAFLVPLPNAIDNDQLANARALVGADAGWLMPEPEIDAERLALEISRCMTNPGLLEKVAGNARALGRPDAAANLADLVESLIGPEQGVTREGMVS